MKSSPDEKPRKAIANDVVAPVRRYFVPEHGVSVVADDACEAVDKAQAKLKKKEQVQHG